MCVFSIEEVQFYLRRNQIQGAFKKSNILFFFLLYAAILQHNVVLAFSVEIKFVDFIQCLCSPVYGFF